MPSAACRYFRDAPEDLLERAGESLECKVLFEGEVLDGQDCLVFVYRGTFDRVPQAASATHSADSGRCFRDAPEDLLERAGESLECKVLFEGEVLDGQDCLVFVYRGTFDRVPQAASATHSADSGRCWCAEQ